MQGIQSAVQADLCGRRQGRKGHGLERHPHAALGKAPRAARRPRAIRLRGARNVSALTSPLCSVALGAIGGGGRSQRGRGWRLMAAVLLVAEPLLQGGLTCARQRRPPVSVQRCSETPCPSFAEEKSVI